MNDDDMPPQPKTLELPKADAVEIALRSIQVDLRDFRSTQDALLNEVRNFGTRLSAVEQSQTEFTAWRSRTSDRVREVTGSDHEQEAKLAEEISARKAVEQRLDAIEKKTDAQTAILEKLEKVVSNPAAKFIGAVIAAGITQYLLTKGIHLP